MVKLLNNIKKYFLKRKLKRFFKRLNWSEKDILGMTHYSSSLIEAKQTLTYNLLSIFLCDKREEKILYSTAKKLVSDGYERDWK
tara:strand:+ start:181199 stop:181450 length:252 start_codon:yes stop_codon:yes gene_type:complete